MMLESAQFSDNTYLEEIAETGIGIYIMFCENNIKEVRNSSRMLFSVLRVDCRVLSLDGA